MGRRVTEVKHERRSEGPITERKEGKETRIRREERGGEVTWAAGKRRK